MQHCQIAFMWPWHGQVSVSLCLWKIDVSIYEQPDIVFSEVKGGLNNPILATIGAAESQNQVQNNLHRIQTQNEYLISDEHCRRILLTISVPSSDLCWPFCFSWMCISTQQWSSRLFAGPVEMTVWTVIWWLYMMSSGMKPWDTSRYSPSEESNIHQLLYLKIPSKNPSSTF